MSNECQKQNAKIIVILYLSFGIWISFVIWALVFDIVYNQLFSNSNYAGFSPNIFPNVSCSISWKKIAPS